MVISRCFVCNWGLTLSNSFLMEEEVKNHIMNECSGFFGDSLVVSIIDMIDIQTFFYSKEAQYVKIQHPVQTNSN